MNTEGQFQLIRQKFVERLNEWRPVFDAFIAQTLAKKSPDTSLDDILMRVHRIAGSAKTFGFAEISEIAAAAELHLHKAKEKPQSLLQTDAIAALKALQHAVQNIAILPNSALGQSDAPAVPEQFLPVGQAPRATILVVDDDDLVRELLVNEFHNSCHLMQAGDGRVVLDLIRAYAAGEKPPDLVLLDVNMPFVNGFDVLKALKNTPATHNIPVIMLTRRDEDDSVIAGISHGASDYIVKPFATSDLVARINRALSAYKHKILIADDDDLIRDLLQQRFQRAGMLAHTVKTGAEALQRALAERPDILILDIMMPGMNGISVLKHMKIDPQLKNIPVVLLTAKIQHENVLLGLQSGAHDYITKPFDTDELFARVNGILQRSRSL